jgi:mannose/cellobiose epimerase-like protein (N-acyl-D-glucosamine 2-epimerase family)
VLHRSVPEAPAAYTDPAFLHDHVRQLLGFYYPRCAAAALLFTRTADSQYLDSYNRASDFIWEHLVDHQHGGWFSLLSRDNCRKQPDFSRGKADFYHPLTERLVAVKALAQQEHQPPPSRR